MDKNFILIMAGGIGSRFWPASRTERPKQFMDFMGTGKSLLQLTYDRFKKTFKDENIFVVTNSAYTDLVAEHLPKLPADNILGEPVGKNTAAAIAYGCYKIHNLFGKSNVVVSPSDHLITDQDVFLATIKNAMDFVEKDKALVTIGITPTRPDTGYGYIQYLDMPVANEIYQVKTFVEKPNKEMAEELVKSADFVWNAGIFVWNTQTIIDEFEKHLPEISSLFGHLKGKWGTKDEDARINEIYPQCRSISIDYGILEHSKHVYLSPGSFPWSDLGTWLSLYENSPKTSNENAILGKSIEVYNSSGNLIYNDDGKPLVVNGVDNMIVVKSNGIVMVCNKEREQEVKQIVNDLSAKYKDKFN
jgi:mannose-1-phosphate guanylyltransferase